MNLADAHFPSFEAMDEAIADIAHLDPIFYAVGSHAPQHVRDALEQLVAYAATRAPRLKHKTPSMVSGHLWGAWGRRHRLTKNGDLVPRGRKP